MGHVLSASHLVSSVLTPRLGTPSLASPCGWACQEPLKKTILNAYHAEKLGGKMVPFGGWDMPLYYELGIMKEHIHTRENAGLFDVSHMLGVKFTGKDRVALLEKVGADSSYY